MDKLLVPMTQATLLLAAMIALTALGVAFARKYRDRKAKDMSETSELISKFRELHAEGGLSDEEFRTIKAKLAVELKAELTTGTATGTATDTATDTAPELNDSSSTG